MKVPLRRSAFYFVSGSVFETTKRGNYFDLTLGVIVMMHSQSLFRDP